MRRRTGRYHNIQEEQTSFEEGRSAKPGPGSQIGAVCPREKETRDIHSFNICPKASHGAQIQCCNKQRRIGPHRNIQEEQTSIEEGKSAPNLAQAAKSEHFVPVKRRQGTSIPSIYAQRLPMGPKYNVATCIEELGCTNTYRRSKHLSKRAKVPNTWPRQPNWSRLPP